MWKNKVIFWLELREFGGLKRVVRAAGDRSVAGNKLLRLLPDARRTRGQTGSAQELPGQAQAQEGAREGEEGGN